MGNRYALTEGWFKSMTPGARRAHYFRDGDRLSACHLIRSISGEEAQNGFTISDRNLGGFLTWVEQAPHALRCRLCRAALLEEDPPKVDLKVIALRELRAGEYIDLFGFGKGYDGRYIIESVEPISDGVNHCSLRREGVAKERLESLEQQSARTHRRT